MSVSTLITVSLLCIMLTSSIIVASPVYWLDLEKQFLYSFDDPEMIRYASHIEDSHKQPIYDISAIAKRINENAPSYPLTRALNLRQLTRTG
uniref:Uncharacterized protein n=1 Tax=Panagrolaimus sp. ES5 TaxID=591445 RepID=A0AC34G9Q8_9BILA